MKKIIKKSSIQSAIVANQYHKEKEYWKTRLAGEVSKTEIPCDYINSEKGEIEYKSFEFIINDDCYNKLMKLRNESDTRLHMILTSALFLLLNRYTENKDIIIGTTIYKQSSKGEFTNTILPLRWLVNNKVSFKELLLKVRQTIGEAVENQIYPIDQMVKDIDLEGENGNAFLLFDTALILENIQDKNYLEPYRPNVVFRFNRTEDGIVGSIDYNSALYKDTTINSLSGHFNTLLIEGLTNINKKIKSINILPEAEKKTMLIDFNDTTESYPDMERIHKLFEKQVEKTPGSIAVIDDTKSITYEDLNRNANKLAGKLLKMGVEKESVVAVMLDRSIDMVISVMAILKAGGAYLPVDLDTPEERVLFILENAACSIIITETKQLRNISFSSIQNIENNNKVKIKLTPKRRHIEAFDDLPLPDRKYLNLNNYRNKIGMASVMNCISLQSTRGCPFKCLYCHKIWSKNHVNRSAQNIFSEVEYYYNKGIRNFSVIDDCFNLDIKESSEFFRKVIENELDIQLFFPNGLRGDIMTFEYIDLMVMAGTRGINLSLETASPRLQKLLKKNLNLDKFKDVVNYIADKYPNVILELASMHGFPGETEEEAMMTLDFIKDIKWLHFPYIHILKIFPNTEMEEYALEHGVKKEDIMVSKDRAFHELPETLPFPKSFTRKYQANFVNEYFLNKKRLEKVLPYQMEVMTEKALILKYNAYLPVAINSVLDLFEFAGLNPALIPDGYIGAEETVPEIFNQEISVSPEFDKETMPKKILFVDLSQHFSSHSMLYNVVEQPLGLLYLQTFMDKKFGSKLEGRVIKSGNDFDSFDELKTIIEEYQPDMIGIRSLTFFKDLFHATTSLIRQWGFEGSLIAGGPYIASDYDTILKDGNIDLVVIGEGEHTLTELIENMLENDFQIPGIDVLEKIEGLALPVNSRNHGLVREIILIDQIGDTLEDEKDENPNIETNSKNLAFVMYTSGTTGRPKGVMVEHKQVNNCIFWMQKEFDFKLGDTMAQRTNLTFDPSVFEIFWPLYRGGKVQIVGDEHSKDANYLINLMAEDNGINMMYCPASLLTVMVHLLNQKNNPPRLKLPKLFIGAEPVSMEVIKEFYNYYDGEVINTYGPTECTINNTFYPIDRNDSRDIIPIGKPIDNNHVYILSQELQPVPSNVYGEICIAGESLTRGYINDRETTAQNFIENPFGEGKLYKTGDIGRWLNDGNIEINGRIDEQVKIRGYRIELGEIQNALTTHPDINNAIVIPKKEKELKEAITECKVCGIWSNYSGITINNDYVCNICDNLNKYKKLIDNYFGDLDDLAKKLKEGSTEKKSKYDCVLVYACERVATYALYKLVDMGFNVMTVTYDSTHYDQASLDNITRLTKEIGVDHMFLRHEKSDQILKESLKIAQTMCKGCIHTSSSLAGKFAYDNGIKYVIGETLSRGQIVENKLVKFIEMGISSVAELESEIKKLELKSSQIDKRIFDIIGINEVSTGELYDKVEFLDFYRYCDVPHDEMISYLNEKDPYWNELDTKAIYSTDCKICEVGNFNHFKVKGTHYTGSAKSWDKRLGLTTLEDLQEDLVLKISATEHSDFMKELGYHNVNFNVKNTTLLCAYYVADGEIKISDLREHLADKLPEYMIPSYFVRINNIPLNTVGKIDKKALPLPDISRSNLASSYVAPENKLEQTITDIWKDVLKVSLVGVEDNFFDLGGSSLDIIMVNSKINDYLNSEIPITTLFTYTTIKSLADYLNNELDPESDRKQNEELVEVMQNGKDLMKSMFSK